MENHESVCVRRGSAYLRHRRARFVGKNIIGKNSLSKSNFGLWSTESYPLCLIICAYDTLLYTNKIMKFTCITITQFQLFR